MFGKIAQDEIFAKQEELIDLAKKIWENPEMSFQEVKASQWIAEFLEKEGFAVERAYAGVPTALRAVWGSGKPVIGFLGEYDALSALSQKVSTQREAVVEGAPGHGCQHNLMTPACIGAALGLKKEMEEKGLSGTIVVYGCPAEEVLTGKVFMARGGAFRELDLAFSWHGGPSCGMTTLGTVTTALNSAKFHFKGVTSHAAADPQNGRSALDAVQLMNMGCEFLREHVTDDVRIHYAFTDVPSSPNVVPGKASVWYFCRALSREAVEDAYARIVRVAEGAAHMTDTQLEVEFTGGCYEMLNNKVLFELCNQVVKDVVPTVWSQEDIDFAKALNEQSPIYQKMIDSGKIKSGTQLEENLVFDMNETLVSGGGSTDVADVQHICPTMMLTTPSSCIGAPGHSWQNAACAGHSIGMKGMLYGARVMAVAALKAVEDPSIIQAAKAEFEEKTAGHAYVCPIPEEVPVP